MAINLEESVKQLTEFLKTEAKTENVVGQAFQLGEFTCVPVMRIGLGLGYGGGEGHGDASGKGKGEGIGGGAGGGLGVEPIGFLTTRGEQISFIAARSGGMRDVFQKVPELIEKMMEKKSAQTTEAN